MKTCVEYVMPASASVAVPRSWPRLEMIEPLTGVVKFRLGPVKSTVNVDERAGLKNGSTLPVGFELSVPDVVM